MKSTPAEIKSHYRNENVVENYVPKRFIEPMGILKHERQVKVINCILSKINDPVVLDLACGPARLSKDISPVKKGYAVDASSGMIAIAKEMVPAQWAVLCQDAFKLKFKPHYFDVVISFRFIRHLQEQDRRKIYAQVQRLIKKEGYFIIDVLNGKTVRWLRLIGKHKYQVYDEVYNQRQFIKEIESAGFLIVAMVPIIKHTLLQALVSKCAKTFCLDSFALKLLTVIEQSSRGAPWEWIAICKHN